MRYPQEGPLITGVLLNWKRPQNVERIVAGWRGGGMVDEIIVWNNNSAAPLPALNGATVIQTSQDMGLYTRFAAACLARNDCVLLQDDDLELPHATLAALHDAWHADPEVLHGVFGRFPRADGSYALIGRGDRDVPVLLTRALLAHRRYAAEFFEVAPKFEHIQHGSRPAGNGEDILLSYTVMKSSGRLNRMHSLPVIELPAPDSIHERDWDGHLQHRTRLLQACEAWLHGETPAIPGI